ncbi:unnamed protein product [Cuscuta campestris]|uniref:Uncharacterized protein n=1 Tax=Cuscuta campestris TaxID=132261 RepID=A0A484K9V8_9ASTE|nr:unnamed protein product [Cuscuta campestris]
MRNRPINPAWRLICRRYQLGAAAGCGDGDGRRRQWRNGNSTAISSDWRRCNSSARKDSTAMMVAALGVAALQFVGDEGGGYWRRKQRRRMAGEGRPAALQLDGGGRPTKKTAAAIGLDGDDGGCRNISHFLRIKRLALKDDMNSGALGNTSPESDTSLPSSALSRTVRQLQSTTALCSVSQSIPRIMSNSLCGSSIKSAGNCLLDKSATLEGG